ncbi:MAG: hypothetical protein JWP31_1056 [Aeromicrobium sp.]|nr:hypothetical protein [Aeromicrobium sp.]
MASEILTVTGTLVLGERVTLPPGAIASVKLVDDEGEVLAGAAIEARETSTGFTLTADPALTASQTLFLWAALRSDTGVWGTTDLVPVDGDTTEVLLTKIED